LNKFHLFFIFSVFLFGCSKEKTWEELIKEGKNAYYSNWLDRAESLYLLALKKAQEVPNNDENLASTYFKLGMLYQYKGLFPKAAYCYNKSLELERKFLGPTNSSIATHLNNLAWLEIRRGDLKKGQQLLSEGLDIWEKLGDFNNMVAVTSLTLQAIVYREKDKNGESEKYFQRALDLSQTLKGVDKGLLFNHWGLLLEKQGEIEKAEDLYKKAIKFHETSHGPKDPPLATSLTFLGSFQIKQGNLEEAEINLKRAEEIQEMVFGSVHPDIVVTLENLEKLFRMRGQEEEANVLDSRVSLIRSKCLSG
jgi:tetratricopeptide (TPR) repeat protein